MGLKSLNFHEEYRTGESNLVDDFYLPCLQESTHYDRAVGYFRSSVYLLAGPALLDYAKRGGEIRLICSPSFTEDDIDAINKGYKSHSDYINEAIDHEIESILLDKSITKNTELLATLITIGTLQVKIAYMEGAQGIYHEKLGVFCDENGDCVSFKGSVNETWSGWHERGNYETIDVFCEWLVGRDNRQVQRNKKYFHNLWNGLVSDLEVKPFPEVGIEKLKSISRNSLDDFDPEELTDYFTIGNDYTKKHGLVNAHTESTRTLLPHQAKALATWKRLGKRGVLEHATGSGKTFTALMAIKDHLKNGGVALVLVPDRLLHKQWYSEICTELSDATVLKAGDNNNKWRINKRLNHFTKPGNDLGKRIVLATMATARLDEFRNMICGGDHLMVIADEVHEIGSVENSKALSIESGPRLGLSATPRRYGDPIGTDKIFKYFGEIVPPPFTLQDAIDSGRLVEYEYHPEPIRLTPDESDAWAEATKKISLEYARSKRDKNNSPIISSRLQNLLIQRSRIAKKASAKVGYAVNVIKQNYREGQSWLIYCEDQYQLAEVLESLKKNGFSPSEYHTGMSGNPEAALEWFKQFGGIMVSIRCLDQGVDIPKISHAIILASSQNPRQFIQRRGRVLRSCKDKYLAVIFDAVVVPVSLQDEPSQLSLLKSELQRSLQFSDMAVNKSGANKLIEIAIELGIDPKEVDLIDTDGVEVNGVHNES